MEPSERASPTEPCDAAPLAGVRAACRRAVVQGFAVLVVALIVAWPCVGQESVHPEPPRRNVLVLYGLQSAMPIVQDWDRGIRTALDSRLESPVRIDREYLDLLRSRDETYRRQWLDLLRLKYARHDPEVILAVHDPAIQFAIANRSELFPDVPLVICSEHFFRVSGGVLPPGVTGATYELAYERTLSLARRLRPGTRHVALVSGSSTFGQSARSEAMAAFSDRSDLTFESLGGLPVDELLQRVAELPADALVLFLV